VNFALSRRHNRKRLGIRLRYLRFTRTSCGQQVVQRRQHVTPGIATAGASPGSGCKPANISGDTPSGAARLWHIRQLRRYSARVRPE
jgi:hypothetical protein